MKDNNIESLSGRKNSSDSDLSDIGLCTVNRHEQQFNIMICCMMTENYNKACESATAIIENSNPNYANKVWIVRGIRRSLLGRKQEADMDFKEAKKYNPECKDFFENKKVLTIEAFPEENRLCSYFPHVVFSSKEFPDVVFLLYKNRCLDHLLVCPL